MNQATMLLHYVVFFFLVAAGASEPVTLVDGWGPGGKPTIGVVYWMEYQMPGESIPRHLPFVAIRTVGPQAEAVYRFIRMSHSSFSNLHYVIKFTTHTPDVRPAKDFFGHNAKLQITDDTAIDLNNYFVFPRERYDIVANPHQMKLWPGHISTIPQEGLERLIAASDGMVRGWQPGYRPLSGFVYWGLPQDFGETPAVGVYIPFVFIDWDEDVCLVARLLQPLATRMHPADTGAPASMFFGKDRMMPTPYNREANLNTFVLILGHLFRMKPDPNVMQLWDWHHTRITSNMDKLKAMVDRMRSVRDSRRRRHGYVMGQDV